MAGAVLHRYFLKAADKFNKTVKKDPMKEYFEAFSWIHDYVPSMKEFLSVDGVRPEANAVVHCEVDKMELMKNEIYHMLDSAITALGDWPDGKVRDIHVLQTKEELEVFYPVGEIYGFAYEYLTAVLSVFEKVKEQYPAIGIEGLAYYDEQVAGGITGAYFHCTPEDHELSITWKWQKCSVCGKVLTEDTFYNSSDWDYGSGSHGCLCSPDCMMEYASRPEVSSNWEFEVEENEQINKKYPEYDCEWTPELLKNVLLKEAMMKRKQ